MFRPCGEAVRAPVTNAEASSSKVNKHIACKCEHCDLEWFSETELYYHKRIHFKNFTKEIKELKSFFCWQCVKMYETKEELVTHVKEHHLLSSQSARRVEREIFICEDCCHVFFNKLILQMHIAHHHTDYKVKRNCLECPRCFKHISTTNFWCHFQFHNMAGPYMCPICCTKYANWNELKNHLKSHPPLLYCNICQLKYDKMNVYLKHLEIHKPYTEDTCESEERTDEEMYALPALVKSCFIAKEKRSKPIYFGIVPTHGLTIQNEIKICILCREICLSEEERTYHILHHHLTPPTTIEEQPEEKQTFVCSCNEKFPHKILLKQHILKNNGSDFVHTELIIRDDSSNIVDKECVEEQIIVMNW